MIVAFVSAGLLYYNYIIEKYNTVKELVFHQEARNHKDTGKHDESHTGHDEGGHKEDGEHHDKHGGGEFGPTHGVRHYNEDKGIVLGKEAIERLGVRFTQVRKLRRRGRYYRLPAQAVIEEENMTGIYVRSPGRQKPRLKFTPVRLIANHGDMATIDARLNYDQSIVTQSAALVRLAELNAAGASGTGHGH